MYIEHVAQTVMSGHNRYKVMSNEFNSKIDPGEPMVYQIRIKGHLGPQWADWFGGVTVTLEDNGETLLTGPMVDQAALHGLLKRVRDLGMPLLSVNCLKSGQGDAAQPAASDVNVQVQFHETHQDLSTRETK